MSEPGFREVDKRQRGLIPALQDLADGMVTLFQQHLALARAEMKNDATVAIRYGAALVFSVTIVFLGYTLLNTAVILFSALAFGLTGAAVASIVLAATNALYGGLAIRTLLARMQEDGLGPRIAGAEIKRSREWAKMIQAQNSPET